MFLEGGYELNGSLFSYPRNSRDVGRKTFEGFNVDTEGTFHCGDTPLCSQHAGGRDQRTWSLRPAWARWHSPVSEYKQCKQSTSNLTVFLFFFMFVFILFSGRVPTHWYLDRPQT